MTEGSVYSKSVAKRQEAQREPRIHIVCPRKKNEPRMDIEVCQKKCDLKDSCRTYTEGLWKDLTK